MTKKGKDLDQGNLAKANEAVDDAKADQPENGASMPLPEKIEDTNELKLDESEKVEKENIVEKIEEKNTDTTDKLKSKLGSRKPESTSDNKKAKNSFSFFSFAIVVAFILFIGASGYAHWWQYQNSLQQQSSLEAQNQRVNQQQSQLSNDIGSRVESLQTNLSQLQNDFARQAQGSQQVVREFQQTREQLEQQLEAQNQRLLKLSSVNSQNWELAEALYLTRLAGQRLVMENNRDAALTLLMGADEIISRQQNPDLFPVRAAFADDITALKVVEPIDKEGLFLRLSAINRQVQNLALTESLNFEREINSQSPITNSEELGWWVKIVNSFESTFSELKSYIRKTELQTAVKPLLMPEEQQQIRLSMGLYIESAQLGLLRDQTLIFNNALAQAQVHLSEYYPESNQRQELILALESLQAETIDRSYPDISGSFRQLNAFIQDINSDGNTGNVSEPINEQSNSEEVNEEDNQETAP